MTVSNFSLNSFTDRPVNGFLESRPIPCNFCCNCSLRQFTDPDDSEVFEFYEMLKKANKVIVLEDYIGYRGWKISQKLYEHIILNKNKNTLLNIIDLD